VGGEGVVEGVVEGVGEGVVEEDDAFFRTFFRRKNEKYKHENSGGISIKKGHRWVFMVFQVWYDT